MAVSDTLLIKNFPFQFSTQERTEFLRKCGAVGIKILSSTRNKHNTAFARLPNAAIAQKVMQKLHQQEVLGSFLVVQYARGQKAMDIYEPDEPKKITKLKDKKKFSSEEIYQRFLEKLNSWSDGVDFRMPIPSHLRYQYPPPTAGTLRNICNQLSEVPQFYTQVLHLMNKMNLPCPFTSVEEETLIANPQHDFVRSTHNLPPPPPPMATSSDNESELSSDGEERVKESTFLMKNTLINKRKRPRGVRPPPVQPTKKTKANFEDVFDDPRTLIDQKKIKSGEIKKVMELERVPEVAASETGFGFIAPVAKPTVENTSSTEKSPKRNEMEEERLEKEAINCITAEALAANKLPKKDMEALPVYKNYAQGAPSCRLYVKNLAKQTTEDDLKFIYSRFRTDNLDMTPQNMFDIRLMQEGRVKGQAFITLQTVQLAQQALAETNAYILHDKPMVVQFARSATAKSQLPES